MPSAQGPELLQLPQVDHTEIEIKGFMTITSGNSSYVGWPLAKASYSSLR